MMIKRIMSLLLMTLLLFSVKESLAQDVQDSIIGKRGTYFNQDFQLLNSYQLEKILSQNQEAYQVYKMAKKNKSTAIVFGGLGGAFIGFPIGQAIAGGEPALWMAALGVVGIVISIPIGSMAKKGEAQAIEMYNAGLGEKRQTSQLKMEFQSSAEGIGLVFRF